MRLSRLMGAAGWSALAGIAMFEAGVVARDLGVPVARGFSREAGTGQAGTGQVAGTAATGQVAMFGEADAYELFMGRWSRQIAPLLVEFASPGSTGSVLDIGSGTGALSAAIVAAKPAALVTGIDPSSEYVAFARARQSSPRARFIVGDAQRLEFPDGQFDATLSLLVVNFIPDRDRALREMIRVTRAGGVIAAAVWDYGGGMEMLRSFWDEAVALAPAAEKRDERHMPLCGPAELAAFWRAHGLRQVEEQPLVIRTTFASFDDYWRPFLGRQGPAGAYVASLSEAERGELASRLRRRLAVGGRDGSFTLTARAWAVKGIKPAESGRPER
jgi:SAM-dependent methyltransferase